MTHRSRILSVLFALLALAPVYAQSIQEWTAPLNGNQPGLLQWTVPGPLAADAQGRVLATAAVWEYQPAYPSSTLIVAELTRLHAANGQVLWSKSQTTSSNSGEVVASPTGGFLVLGRDVLANGLKLTWHHPDGIQQWSRTVPNCNGATRHGLAVDSQGTAYLCGYDFLGGLIVAAFDAAGTQLWVQNISYASSSSSEPAGLAFDGNAALYLRATVYGPPPAYTRTLRVTKLSLTGSVQWTQTAPGQTKTSFTGTTYEAIHADPNGVVIGGETLGGGGTSHLGYLARYDGAGALQWSRTIAGTTPDNCVVNYIEAEANGTLWVVSSSAAVAGQPPYYARVLVNRFDSQGTPLSSETYAPAPPLEDSYAAGLVLGSAGQAWILAQDLKQYQQPVLKVPRLALFDANGALVATQALNPTTTVSDETVWVARAAPGNRLLLGGGEGTSYGDAAFLTQLDLGDSPQGYCTAKVNSLGCTPTLSFTGFPSASAVQGFSVQVHNVRDHKSGLFLYGTSGAAATPFQNGTLCVQAPIKRTPASNSGGTVACTGLYALDFNAFAAGSLGGNPLPALQVVGTTVYCQAWGRDPGFAAPNNTTLSSALSYVVQP